MSRYTPHTKYTPEQLDRYAIHDLEVDLACAYRDIQPEYAIKVQQELEERWAAYAAAYGTEQAEHSRTAVRTLITTVMT